MEDASTSAGGLPLLQFTLAELWEARNKEQGLIAAATLEAMGGVGGALTKHADLVLRQLLPEERQEARRLLLSLVTADGTRGRRRADELQATVGPARNALEALIRGRLLVARELQGETEYELAHESLLTQWPALADWLAADFEVERNRRRLEAAANEWRARVDRSPDALLRGQRLRDFVKLGAPRESSLEAEFLMASGRHQRRRRALSALAVVAIPLSLGGVALVTSLHSRHEIRTAVDGSLARAETTLTAAEQTAEASSQERSRALALFDQSGATAFERANSMWTDVLALEHRADLDFISAIQLLRSALAIDSQREDIRRLLTSASFSRLALAERVHRGSLADELLTELRVLAPDSPQLAARLAPAKLALGVVPYDARIRLEKYENHQGLLEPVFQKDLSGRDSIELEPGSYRLSMTAPGYAPVAYPLALIASERMVIDLALPPTAAVPGGYVFIPAGRFFLGSEDDETLRQAQVSAPIHEYKTAQFVIGRTEVTFFEWAQFLKDLSPAEQQRRRPMIVSTKGAIHSGAPARQELAIAPATHLRPVRRAVG